MTLIPLHTKETAPEQAKPILERYEKNIGLIPNLFRLLAHSPDALKGVADLHAGLGRSLGARTRERIHIMTAEVNGCDYCLTTHTYLAGKFTKLTPEDMELNRKGHSTDPKADAALQFAYKVAKSRGHIEAADFEAVRAAGYTDAQIVDIVAEIAFSFTTNLFDNTFKTDFDTGFPVLHTHYNELEGAAK
ncbi:carboxymuconolactone decarboxylase family protein [Occallatibacter riparius]|uniref:Peroxidase-related enzyme n=1 Tax=Occallatibacter riparius TaxID=1002689 RepID=A0A9J7BJ16_9BACT|nr:peroxidase-related enzyme [Occallatibacter riparius]UWZ81786.1 peroxidase-related enzyme [Occallatibacter riparius]